MEGCESGITESADSIRKRGASAPPPGKTVYKATSNMAEARNRDAMKGGQPGDGCTARPTYPRVADPRALLCTRAEGRALWHADRGQIGAARLFTGLTGSFPQGNER